jgi:hypothetical protein
MAEPAGSGIKCRRQRIGRGIRPLACRRAPSPLWVASCLWSTHEMLFRN